MTLIDTHTHLFAEQFDEDRAEVVRAAIGQGVEKLFLPNIDSTTSAAMDALAEAFPEHCYPMMGIHPSSIKSNYKEELAHAERALFAEGANYYGVGETGLDYYWDTTFVAEQKESLAQHAAWAKTLDLPIILHTRDSFDDNYAIMRNAQDGRLKGIFHCFGGSLEEAKKVMDLGFLMGIGGVVTFKNSGQQLRDVLKEVPLESLVLETDSPYLAPHPNRGQRNESSWITLVVQKLAEVKELDVAEVARVTTENAMNLFGLER
ncbi:MAG: TatD family hydrolase [Saprospiraceae bacterium]|nr:TatD family hydrolase [Saprospiraceae bacterium]